MAKYTTTKSKFSGNEQVQGMKVTDLLALLMIRFILDADSSHDMG